MYSVRGTATWVCVASLFILFVASVVLVCTAGIHKTKKCALGVNKMESGTTSTSAARIETHFPPSRTPVSLTSPDIFTCTTWFDAPAGGKWEAFVRGMESLVEHNPGIVQKMGRWLVVNEPRTKTSPDWQQRVKHQFPWIQFVQKEENARGQAASMNSILDEIKPCRYWLHWEEAWFCTRAFLDDALKILSGNKITQLQLTRTPPSQTSDWFSQRTLGQDALGWASVPSYPEAFENKRIGDINMAANTLWPVYSLRPSLNVASFYGSLPKFSTKPEMWPLRFEWDFGRNWVLAGGKKAIFIDAPVTRSATHKSTYHM